MANKDIFQQIVAVQTGAEQYGIDNMEIKEDVDDAVMSSIPDAPLYIESMCTVREVMHNEKDDFPPGDMCRPCHSEKPGPISQYA